MNPLVKALKTRTVLELAVWSALEAAPVLLFGRAVARATDAFLTHHVETGLGWLGALALAAVAGAVGAGRAYRPLARIIEPFRDALVRRVVRGALLDSARRGRGDDAAVARLTHQVEIVRDTFAGVLMVARDASVTLVTALIGLWTLVPIALWLVLPPLVVGIALFFAIITRIAARQRDLLIAEEKISEAGTAMITGLRDVVACGAESSVAGTLGSLIDRQAKAARAVARLAALRTLCLAVGGRLPLLLVLFGTPWLIRHAASPGAVLGALAYVLTGLEPALHAAVRGLGSSGVRLTVTLDRILRATPPSVTLVSPSGSASVLASGGDCGGRVSLDRVTFSYGQRADPVIDHLSLDIPDGDHLAIVGPSGIGKSTLAVLIAGLREPSRGTVHVGGVPASGAAPHSRVLIPQEAYVFTGTLRENLTYLCPSCDPAEASPILGPLTDRLGGFDAIVAPSTLSAGERQLIALGRAYLSRARLIILDEATCHLDAASEERAESAFAARPGTLIVIAHRISSARRARRILVLDGTDARLGGHDELLAASPLYGELNGFWTVAPDNATLG